MPVSKRRANAKPKQSKRPKIAMQEPIKSMQKTPIKDIKITNVIPDDIPINYSNNLLIQQVDGLFHLYFMQTLQPIILTEEDLHSIKTIESKCVSRVILTPLTMARHLRVVDETFNKYLKVIGSSAKDYKEFIEQEEKATKKAIGE